MNIDKKIQEKTLRNRLTAVGIVLSLVLGLLVPCFDALPVSAVSNGNWDDGVNYMEEAITQAHGFNLANNIDNVSFTIGNTTYSSNGTGAVTVQAGSNDPADVAVNMEYKFTREQMLESGVLTNGGYVYYQMNANIKIENAIFGVGRYVTDASWSTTEPAGYYSIDTNGLITIRYTQAYLNHLKTSNDVVGTLNFNGKIQRKGGENGDKNFDFGKVDVTVDFDDITPKISKDYQDVRGDDSSHDLVWTITITNPGSVVQMENYTLTDLLDGSPAEWTDATIEPEGVGTFGADGTVSFTHQDNPPETITIKYTTNNAATNTKYENVAKLQKGDETPIEAKKEATIEDALEVSKYGQADYELETSMKDRIKWTINVRHKASDSLKNVVVTEDSAHPFDQAYESATSNNYGSTYVQVIDKATGQTIDSSKYTINGNTLIFNDDSSIPSEVDIVFWTQETIPTQTEEINNGNDSSTVSPVAQDVSNSVSAGREGLDTITVPSTKTYDHSINLSKSLDNVNYDEGTMMWKFSIETGGQNLKESVNGYRLTDPIFTHLTQDDMSKIGFNLIDTNGTTVSSRFVKSDGSTTSTLGDDYGVQLSLSGDTITVRYTDQDKPICNKIQLYYYTNIEDYIKNNYGEDTLRSYQSGDSVPITNTATATNRDGDSTMTSTGTGTGELQKRVEANKSRTGVSDDITYSLGGDDTTDKVLSWYVHLTNDSGFTSNTSGYVYTDELKSSNSNVQHMITTTQWDEIVVYGSRDYYADYSALEPLGALVDKQKLAQDASGNTTKFGIKFTGGIDALNYHHIYIVYKSTAKTSQIPNDSTVKFSNDYQIFDHDWQTTDGLTYTRESPNPAKTFTIKVNKNWNDISGNRPDEVSFKVYRVLADVKGPDGVLPLEPDWGEAIGTYTMQVNNGGQNQNSNQMVFVDIDGNEVKFDRWKYYSEDNSYQLYYYKIEEDPVPTGYTASGSGNSFIVRPSEQADFQKEQTITNAQLGEFKKTAIDYTGEAVVKQKQSELPIKTMTINGERQPCYLIGWRVWLKMDDETIYEDTIPEGMYFVTGHEDGLEDYAPYGYNDGWKTTQSGVDLFADNTGQIKITEIDSNHYTFKQSNKGLYALVYYTAVPINNLDNVLDGLNKVTNTVKTDEETKSATLQIVRDVQDDETSIEKSFNKGISAGYLNYSIAVNSNAKKYSNNGTIDITDNLFYAGGTKSAGDLSYVLESVKIYEQKDGTADKDKELSPSQYSYTVEYGASSKDLTISNYGATGYNQGDGKKDAVAYRVTGWSPGDKIAISITRNPDVDASKNAIIVIEGGKFNFTGSNQSWYLDKKATYTFDSYQEITVPSDAAYIYVIDTGEPDYKEVGEDGKNMIITAVEGSVLSAAQLSLTVPDETPLIVEYTYKVTGWESTDTLRFTNTASFDEDNGSGSSTSYDNEMQVSNSGGDVTTSAYPKIYKTNVNNYAINTLSATFKVAKYDTSTKQWVYADEITVEGSGDQQRRVLKFPEEALTEGNDRYPNGAADLEFDEEDDVNKIHRFALTSGTLYKFVEIKAPPNYRSPDWSDGKTFSDNTEFVFYYAYDGYSGTIPNDAKGKVQTISNAGTINIPNSNMISISAKKTFSGETLPTNASVTLKLYWATSKRADMSSWQEVTHDTLSAVADGYNPERIITYSSSGENTVTWDGLPSGANGSSIYYFVKEESYMIDDVTYTYDSVTGNYKNGSTEGEYKAVYTGNGTNTANSQIEVDNSEGVIVKKIWRDIDGNVMESAPEDPTTKSGVSVNFTVYGYKNGTRIALNLPVKALTETNNYTYKLPDRVSDTDGNSYALSYFDNFEIAETLTTHQQEVLGNRFTVSTTRKIKDGTGLLEITNTDTYTVLNGKLQVEKDWLRNDAGDTESITVELYRQAYNADGTPYVPPDIQQTQSSRSLPKGMFSMRRAQTALAEAQDESTEQSEVVEQVSVPNMMNKPRLVIGQLNTILATASEKYKQIDNITLNEEIDLTQLLAGLDVTRIEMSSDGGGQFTVGYIETSNENTSQEWGQGYGGSSDEIVGDISIDSSCSNINLNLANYYNSPVKNVQFYDEDTGVWINLNESSDTELAAGDYPISTLLSGKNITKIKVILQSGGSRNGYAKLTWTKTVEKQTNKDKTYQYDSGVSTFTEIYNPIQWGKLVNQWNGSSPCNLQWVRFYYTPKGPDVEITDKPEQATAIGGDTKELEATTTDGTIIWESSDPNVATVDENEKITFAAVTEEKTVTIKASATADGTTNSDSVTYTVSPFKITNKPADLTTREGNTFTPETNASDDVTITVGVNQPATVADGIVTFTSNGTVTITATHGSASDSVTFTVSSADFTPTITPDKLHVGGTAALNADYTGVTWSIKSEGKKGDADLEGTTVKATKNGLVTFVGTRNGVTKEVTLEICSIKVGYNGEDVVPENLTVNIDSSLPLKNILGDVTVTTSDSDVAYYDADTQSIVTGEKIGKATITVQDAGGGGQTLTFTIQTRVEEVAPEIPTTAEKLQDITITKNNDWKSEVIDDLPLNDGNGHNYRYFIKETSTGNYIPIAYTSNGLELSRYSTTRLALANAVEENESESVELPTSGSTGTQIYYTLGSLLLLLSAAGYVTAKRRRWSDG